MAKDPKKVIGFALALCVLAAAVLILIFGVPSWVPVIGEKTTSDSDKESGKTTEQKENAAVNTVYVDKNGVNTSMNKDQAKKEGYTFLNTETGRYEKPPEPAPKPEANTTSNATANATKDETTAKKTGTKDTKGDEDAAEGKNDVFEAKGLPADSFIWQGYMDTVDAWKKSHPRQFDYGDDTYIAWLPKGDETRQPYEEDLQPSWAAVYGSSEKGFFQYPDKGSGANGQYMTVLENGNVAYYYAQGTKDSNDRMDIILSYGRAAGDDRATRYAHFGKNQQNSIGKKDLTINDDFKDVVWWDETITNKEDSEEQPATEPAPAEKPTAEEQPAAEQAASESGETASGQVLPPNEVAVEEVDPYLDIN